jgi:hypothetical protein
MPLAKDLRAEADVLQRRATELRERADQVERNFQPNQQPSLEERIYSMMALPVRTTAGFHPDEYNGTTLSREALDARDARNPPKLVFERAQALALAAALRKLLWAASKVGPRSEEFREILEDFNKVQP